MANQINENPQTYTSSSSFKLRYIRLGYHYFISNSIYIMFIFFIIPLVNNFAQLWNLLIKFNHFTFISFLFIITIVHFFMQKSSRKIYLVDFACSKPNPSCKASKTYCMERTLRYGGFSQVNIEFQRKLLERSGLGDETYLPPSAHQDPPQPSFDAARKEVESLVFSAIDELLGKTEFLAKDIGILVLNSSIFHPMPSLCATIVNHYKFKEDILSYNLSGMGCSAGLISLDLAKDLLKVHPNSYALVVSVESLTQNWYCGNNLSMLVSNCLFRMGGAALLLSNKHDDRCRSKYQLAHIVRTHNGAYDTSYRCAYQQEDDQGRCGLALSKDIMVVAGQALKQNITKLGPLVLPLSEQLLFLGVYVAKKVLGMRKMKLYMPDFKLAFEHFCVHAGGRAVLDELEKKLELSRWHMEPSRMTLYRYGNTSSSCLWYELAYTEAKGRIKKGDRIWQIGLGSGFKCNSAVWRALRNIHPNEVNNPWMDEIDNFPVHVPKVSPFVMPTIDDMIVS